MNPAIVPITGILDIDFNRPGVPYTAQLLMPDLYKIGNNYNCTWGGTEQNAICGTGSTVEEALQEWDRQLFQRINNLQPGDQCGAEAKKILSTAEKDPNIALQKTSKENHPPSTVTQDPPEEHQPTSENLSPGRKHTTDQSNTDGSEFR